MKTPLEESRQETINALQSIIEKNYDAEKGYKKAMEDAENPALRGFLQQQAAKRSNYATAIDQELRLLGEQPKESGSVTGSLHRAWIDIKSTVAGNTDEAVLEEVIRGEKASVEDYQDALNKPNLAPQINNVLQTQLNDIQSTLNKVKRLEDITS